MALGKRSVAAIGKFPEEECVINALSGVQGISDVELVGRETTEQTLLLPRRTDIKQYETVKFNYGNFTYSIGSNFTQGRKGQVTIYGVAGGQCPPADYLDAYENMVQITAPALTKACFPGAEFKQSSSRKCTR